MADDKKSGKKSKGTTLVLLLVLVLAGAFALGHFRPETPYLGPGVSRVMAVFNVATDTTGEGTYTVTVTELRVDDAEFKAGESIDLQIRVFRTDAEGKKTGDPIFDSTKFGDRLGEAGNKDKPLVSRWPDQGFEVSYKLGDQFYIEVLDRKGIGNQLWEFTTDKQARAIPLGGTIKFETFDERTPKAPGKSFVTFRAQQKGK